MGRFSTVCIFAAALGMLSGCAAVNDHNIKVRQGKSSTVIGCAPNDIAVEMTGASTWTATCRKKVFYCQIVPGILDTSATCTPKME